METAAMSEIAVQEVELPAERSVEELVQRSQKVLEAQKQAMVKGEHYGVIPGTPKPTLLKPGAEKLCALFMLRPEYEVRSVREEGMISHTARCGVFHIPTGAKVAEGMGSCNSREKKYRKAEAWDIDNTLLKMACKRALVAAVLVATAASDVFAQDLEDRPEEAAGSDDQIGTRSGKFRRIQKLMGDFDKTGVQPPGQYESWRDSWIAGVADATGKDVKELTYGEATALISDMELQLKALDREVIRPEPSTSGDPEDDIPF